MQTYCPCSASVIKMDIRHFFAFLLEESLSTLNIFAGSFSIKLVRESMTDKLLFQAWNSTWRAKTFHSLIVDRESREWSGSCGGWGNHWYSNIRCHRDSCNNQGLLPSARKYPQNMVHTVLQYVPFLPLFHAIKMLTPEGSWCKNRTTNYLNTFQHILYYMEVWQKTSFFKKILRIQQKSYQMLITDNSFLWDKLSWLLEDPKETAGSDEQNNIQSAASVHHKTGAIGLKSNLKLFSVHKGSLVKTLQQWFKISSWRPLSTFREAFSIHKELN